MRLHVNENEWRSVSIEASEKGTGRMKFKKEWNISHIDTCRGREVGDDVKDLGADIADDYQDGLLQENLYVPSLILSPFRDSFLSNLPQILHSDSSNLIHLIAISTKYIRAEGFSKCTLHKSSGESDTEEKVSGHFKIPAWVNENSKVMLLRSFRNRWSIYQDEVSWSKTLKICKPWGYLLEVLSKPFKIM